MVFEVDVVQLDGFAMKVKPSEKCEDAELDETGEFESSFAVWNCSKAELITSSGLSYSEDVSIRFRAWGTAPQKILKLRESGVLKFLICAFFSLF